jgi:hypothetical protein
MGQLKPSEVRLLIFFCLTVLGLASFFGYEQYAKKTALLTAKKGQLEADRQHLLTLKTQLSEYNEKLVWMNDKQPLARDEYAAKDALDRVVSLRGIEAADLTLISSPPEKSPQLEEYYWAFERRMVVQGSLQNIVQWTTSLQSETAFRAVTQLHIFPKKKKEPETLTCEITVEQRYATDEVIKKTAPGTALAAITAQMTAPTTTIAPELSGPGIPKPMPNTSPAAEANSVAGEVEKSTDERPSVSRRVVTPGTADEESKPVRPKVRLPKPALPKDTSTSIGNGQSSGLLANARRSNASKVPLPPVMQEDLDAAKQFAYDNDTNVEAVRTGVVAHEEPEASAPMPAFRVSAEQLPLAPDTVNVPLRAVGEAWDANTPSARATEPDAQPKPTAPELPQTY